MNLGNLLSAHKWKFSFTIFLILMESAVGVLFPLFIGYAVADAVTGEYAGALKLCSLGLAAIIFGGARRFFDSRFYAQIYQKLGSEIISKIKGDLPSIKTARLGMIREGVEFMENSMPALIQTGIEIVGTAAMIAILDLRVFFGCLIVFFLIFVVYFLTRKRTTRLNSGYNDEIEKQVDIINKKDKELLSNHLKDTMKWNIKLSDLEVFNFSVSWLILIAFMAVSIILAAGGGNIEYGALFALVIYVFQYTECIMMLPHFYQNWLRLLEIKGRLQRV